MSLKNLLYCQTLNNKPTFSSQPPLEKQDVGRWMKSSIDVNAVSKG